MAGIMKMELHPVATARWMTLEEAPDWIEFEIGNVGNGTPEVLQIFVLQLTDPSGDAHFYFFNDQGRRLLLSKMSSVVIPT